MDYIEVRGTDREIGRSLGEQAREAIRRDLDLRLSKNTGKLSPEASRLARTVILTHHPEIFEELAGVAEGAGVEVERLLAVNHVEIGDEPDRCTPVFLKNSPDGPLVAKNSDVPPAEVGISDCIVRKACPDRGLAFVQVVYPGWLCGYNMLNSAGLAVTSASVGSVFATTGLRLDLRLRLYALMRTCRTVPELVRGLRAIPLTGKGIALAAGDANGDCAIIEAAIPFIATRAEDKPFAYSTNLFMSRGLEQADKRPSDRRYICEYRYGYLRWVEENNSPKNAEDMQLLLRSHEPWAPCRHGGSHGSQTVYSMISFPRQKRSLVAHGAPCSTQYQEYRL